MFNILYNGTLAIVVNDTAKLNEIKGYIQGLEQFSMAPSSSPV